MHVWSNIALERNEQAKKQLKRESVTDTPLSTANIQYILRVLACVLPSGGIPILTELFQYSLHLLDTRAKGDASV